MYDGSRAWDGRIAEPHIDRAVPHAVVMTVRGLGVSPGAFRPS